MRFHDDGTRWELVRALAVVAFALGLVALLVWGHPSQTFVTVVWVVSYASLIVKDLGVRLAFLATVAICMLAVPFPYALVLLIQLPPVVFGFTPFHVHVYFVRSLYGALAGAGFGFTAFKDRVEGTADEILPNLGRPGYRLRWGKLFDPSYGFRAVTSTWPPATPNWPRSRVPAFPCRSSASSSGRTGWCSFSTAATSRRSPQVRRARPTTRCTSVRRSVPVPAVRS